MRFLCRIRGEKGREIGVVPPPEVMASLAGLPPAVVDRELARQCVELAVPAMIAKVSRIPRGPINVIATKEDTGESWLFEGCETKVQAICRTDALSGIKQEPVDATR